jgi:hypothetical protein
MTSLSKKLVVVVVIVDDDFGAAAVLIAVVVADNRCRNRAVIEQTRYGLLKGALATGKRANGRFDIAAGSVATGIIDQIVARGPTAVVLHTSTSTSTTTGHLSRFSLKATVEVDQLLLAFRHLPQEAAVVHSGR